MPFSYSAIGGGGTLLFRVGRVVEGGPVMVVSSAVVVFIRRRTPLERTVTKPSSSECGSSWAGESGWGAVSSGDGSTRFVGGDSSGGRGGGSPGSGGGGHHFVGSQWISIFVVGHISLLGVA